MKAILSTLILLISTLTFSQSVVEGRIMEGADSSPLAYVNIGVIGKSVGTVSDRNGNFTLKIPTTLDQDTLRVSMIGYKSQEFIVSDFREKVRKDYNISMEKQTLKIPTIAIVDNTMKSKIIGNKTTTKNFTLGFQDEKLGNELAILVKTKGRKTLIRDFNLSIVNNDFDTLRIRLNFYENKRGRPGAIINTENIILETTLEENVLSVDLSSYQLSMDKDFFVSIEYIEDLGEGDLTFSAAYPARKFYYRSASQGKWKTIKGLGIGMNVRVLQ